MLIVGRDDAPVIEMNRSALVQLASPTKHLEIVPGATHLFEERGALDHVADLASDRLDRYIVRPANDGAV